MLVGKCMRRLCRVGLGQAGLGCVGLGRAERAKLSDWTYGRAAAGPSFSMEVGMHSSRDDLSQE